MALSFAELIRRRKPGCDEGVSCSPLTSAISPWTLIALLLLLRPIGLSFGTDNYHFGEFLLPWWSAHEFGMIPYWEYVPARGLMNYVPGFCASVFMDGTAADVYSVFPAVQLIYLIGGCFILHRTLGAFPAFLMLLLMPEACGFFEIDMMLTAALCLVCERFSRSSPRWWLVTWSYLCAAAILFAPAQGGAWALATLPLALVSLYRSIQMESHRERLAPLLSIAGGVLLFAVTPLGKMFLGAVRNVAEQGSANTAAYGIPWIMTGFQTPSAIEFFRASFIGVPIVAAVFAVHALGRIDSPWGRRVLVYAIPVGLLMMLSIPRTAGRIDPNQVSRLGMTSIWALAMLLPVLLWVGLPRNRRAIAVLVVTISAGTLTPWFGLSDLKNLLHYRANAETHPIPMLGHRPPGKPIEPPLVIDGRTVGMPNLGKANVSPAEFARLEDLRDALGGLLEPGETFLDLTNHNARYFYLGYPSPIEGAIYNLPSEKQQLRALKTLKASPTPVALAWTDDIALHDGGYVSLRTHLIYRDLVTRYRPVEIDECIFLVEPSRAPKTRDRDAELALLDRAFRAADLGPMPRAWGQSFKTLASNLESVARLSDQVPMERVALSDNSTGSWEVTGAKPGVNFDIAELNLSGDEAGILVFDLETSDPDEYMVLDVAWEGVGDEPSPDRKVTFAGKSQRFVVPLDAMPRWLLCEHLQSLSIKVTNIAAQATMTIKNVELFQRRAVGLAQRE